MLKIIRHGRKGSHILSPFGSRKEHSGKPSSRTPSGIRILDQRHIKGSERYGAERRGILFLRRVEYEEVYKDRFYGTLKSEVERIWEKGHVILFDVDVKGAWSLKQYFGDNAFSILVVPPSMEVLEQRLRGRGTDSEEAIVERLAKAKWELEYAAGKADYELVNDKLEDTFAESESVVASFLAE